MWTNALLILLVLTATIGSAEAHHNLGIRLSDTCLTLIKLNASQTDCPTYEEILLVFPDSSRRDISGNFTYIDGVLQREPPQIDKHFEYYRQIDDEHLFIDPPYDSTFHMDMIVIETQIPTYKVKSSYYITNDTVTFGHSRMMDGRCQNASIGADVWLEYLGDTINYMKNDCDLDYTNVSTIDKLILIPSEIGEEFRQKYYEMEKWLVEMAEKCLTYGCI